MRAKQERGPRRTYTSEFKVEAVNLAKQIGLTTAARRLGIPDATLWNWCYRYGTETKTTRPPPPKPSANELEAENARLRKELLEAKQDLEIVKKAAAYFAKESR